MANIYKIAQINNKNPNSEENKSQYVRTIQFPPEDSDSNVVIVQFGVQAAPGDLIEVNYDTEDIRGNQSPIIVGKTGIFEIDKDAELSFVNIKVTDASYGSMQDVNGLTMSHLLLLDVMYYEVEGA